MGSHVEQRADSWRKLVKLVGACEEGGKGKERRERKREGEEESEGMSVRGRGEEGGSKE